jgi:hypothetical protein
MVDILCTLAMLVAECGVSGRDSVNGKVSVFIEGKVLHKP